MLAGILIRAAEEPPPLLDIDGTVFIQFGLFVVMFIVLSRVLYKPFLQLHDQRQAGTGGARHEAEELEVKTKAMATDYDSRLAASKAKAADERKQLHAEAAKREAEILEAARGKAAAVTTEARTRIANEAAAAKQKLDAEAAVLAKTVAKRILGREVH